MKRNYSEGTWFAVPLRKGGYAVGIVARASRACILAYFFGPRREAIPRLDEILNLNAASAISVLRVGTLGLINKEWPIIGEAQSFNRSNWPMPVFIRREILPPFKKWRVYYLDADPKKRIREELETDDGADLPTDSLSGYGAAEIKLTKLLIS